jgi:hypothetical protein
MARLLRYGEGDRVGLRRYGEGERLRGRYLGPILVSWCYTKNFAGQGKLPWLSDAPSSPKTLLESLISDSMCWLTLFALCWVSNTSPSEVELARDVAISNTSVCLLQSQRLNSGCQLASCCGDD